MSKTIKERFILMSGAMVPPTLSGIKTQTRRILEVQPVFVDGLWHAFYPWGDGGHGIYETEEEMLAEYTKLSLAHLRYGKVGDRLWVRENFHILDRGTERGGAVRTIVYKATGCEIQPTRPDHPIHAMQAPKAYPSIHMPRWASRIDLQILSIRVQRLQEITEEDAIAEGIEQLAPGADGRQRWKCYAEYGGWCEAPRLSYKTLWEKINGAGSWDANPWVAAIEFRKLEAPHG